MKIELTFTFEADYWPSTFDEMDMIEYIATINGVSEDSIVYSAEEVI